MNKLRTGAARFMHRRHARRAARRDISTSFVTLPLPRTIGVVARGKQLIEGNFLFSGLLVEGPEQSIWQIAQNNPLVSDEIHGCAWLDDLAAVGDDAARQKAQSWVADWIAAYGGGDGPGWTPGITGRRLIRWINHGAFLLRGQGKDFSTKFYRTLGQQTVFVSQRWVAAHPGLRRFEALSGAIYGGLSLKNMDQSIDTLVAALAIECDTRIGDDGSIESRNPEELLEVLSLLIWTRDALQSAERTVPQSVSSAITRIAPAMRALRHADGGLARFHGGGRGIDGRLDEALAYSGVRSTPSTAPLMGYARLTSGRTTVIVDAAAPPSGPSSIYAHASTLALELTSGRRPVIVSCGSGARFGQNWLRASRATPSHSTVMIEGVSSSHLADRPHETGAKEELVEIPRQVRCDHMQTESGRKLELSHNGYQPDFGLTHGRTLELSVDGRTLIGEDYLMTLGDSDKAIFGKALKSAVDRGIPYTVRFHLHPDVDVDVNTEGSAAALRLKSGEVWVFSHDGTAKLSLSASVYLENGRLKPRATQQVVLSGHALAYATRVRWSLAKAQDTPSFVRDFPKGDRMDLTD
ncbi:heparinase II/III family protein [Yoonia litorea]|uniref:heparinase II/III family protein n=1 Tax=Yoonia litorea TaxID=1123755 RepID=UPI00287FF452|nr:heparinase II/III family protein [Yoonia litorea]